MPTAGHRIRQWRNIYFRRCSVSFTVLKKTEIKNVNMIRFFKSIETTLQKKDGRVGDLEDILDPRSFKFSSFYSTLTSKVPIMPSIRSLVVRRVT